MSPNLSYRPELEGSPWLEEIKQLLIEGMGRDEQKEEAWKVAQEIETEARKGPEKARPAWIGYKGWFRAWVYNCGYMYTREEKWKKLPKTVVPDLKFGLLPPEQAVGKMQEERRARVHAAISLLDMERMRKRDLSDPETYEDTVMSVVKAQDEYQQVLEAWTQMERRRKDG